MNLTLSCCFITVHDQDEALAFYHDLLGLEVRTDVRIGAGRWLTVGTPGGVDISLETPDRRRVTMRRSARSWTTAACPR
jgi:catechol 2,3-dioxygenase-like lactoylglutathione lyase family enzyme